MKWFKHKKRTTIPINIGVEYMDLAEEAKRREDAESVARFTLIARNPLKGGDHINIQLSYSCRPTGQIIRISRLLVLISDTWTEIDKQEEDCELPIV
jgi:hypothetical protein